MAANRTSHFDDQWSLDTFFSLQGQRSIRSATTNISRIIPLIPSASSASSIQLIG